MNARPGRDQGAVDEFVQRFGAVMVASGMPRMPALTFAVLLADDAGRLTADELMERLRISRGSVSAAVRYLIEAGVVRREREPGSRSDRYALLADGWAEMTIRRQASLAAWIDSARFGADALGRTTPAGQRLAESAAFFEFLQGEMPALLRRWKASRSAGADG